MEVSAKIISSAKILWGLLKGFLWERRKFAFLVYGALFLNLVCWGIFFWLFKTEQSFVILHYNAFLGIDAVIDMEIKRNFFEMYFAPASGLLFWFFNLFLALVLGFFADFSNAGATTKKNSFGSLGKTNRGVSFDPGILGISIILSGGLVLQFAILLYAVCIFSVNK